MTDLRQLLADANPVPAVQVPEALRAELMAEVLRTPPPPQRRRIRVQWPIPSVIAGLVVAGGVATAGALFVSERTRDQSAALTTSPAITGDQGSPVAYGQRCGALPRASSPRRPTRLAWRRTSTGSSTAAVDW